MRWLKRVISIGLLVAAAAIALSTGLSDHSDDYGQVPLPQGGIVHLPQGRVVVYYSQLGDGSDQIRQLTAPLTFRAVPAGGGPVVPMSAKDGTPPGVAVQRSETIGELGAVAELHVPSPGEYYVSGRTNLPEGSSFLKFGTNAGQAVLDRWRLLAGLVIGAIIISLIPVPRHKRRWEDENAAPTGWSSDSRSPYAG